MSKPHSHEDTEVTEPLVKRAKMDDYMVETIESLKSKIVNSDGKLQAILSDELYQSVPPIQMYIGHVRDLKELSKIISILNEKIPLKEHSYLKRAYKRDVILCPVNHLDDTSNKSIQDYIEQYTSELKDSFEYFRIIDLPAQAPKLKKQHLIITRSWSCHFHPNKYLEKLFNGDVFSAELIQRHRKFMGMAFEVAKWNLSRINPKLALSDILLRDTNATVVVDPDWQRVVTVTFDNRENHPLQHSAMLAIDKVAITQNGGAWAASGEPAIDKELLVHLNNVYPKTVFSARKYFEKGSKVNFPPDSPYLCTGYNVYLIREPCVMCAMGLVHARAKRIFFCFKNSLHGALCSKTKLQCVPSLNHHFEVFTDFV